jgi:pimeloyl-ACP methyl ester carboxylesterase
MLVICWRQAGRVSGQFDKEVSMKANIWLGVLILAFTSPMCCPEAVLSQTYSGRIETKTVDVQGHKMHVQIAGLEHRLPGRPVVVFESGLGGPLEVWKTVFPLIARFAPVLSYDRAGIGQSDSDGQVPTPKHVTERLHALLQQIGVIPPYVLVGHSIGGPFTRMFTGLYPEEVAGLVYVDPMDFTQTKAEDLAAFEAIGSGEEGRAAFHRLEEKLYQQLPPGVQAEGKMARDWFEQGFREFETIHPVPDIPLVVLMALKYEYEPLAQENRLPFDLHAYFDALMKQRLEKLPRLARAVPEGTLVMTSDSGHFIQNQEPELVVWAIERVVFPDIRRQLRRAIDKQGSTAGTETYFRLKKVYPPGRFDEELLNILGAELLQGGKVPEALAIFELNVREYPSAWGAYDSLASGYMTQGNREKAITCYRKSLELNPQNQDAVDMLKKLEKK